MSLVYVWVPFRARCLVVGGGREVVPGYGICMLLSRKEFLYAVIACMKSAFQGVLLLYGTCQYFYIHLAGASGSQGIALPPVAW